MRLLLVVLVVLGLAGPAAALEVEPASGSWPLRPRPEVVRGFEAPSGPWGPGHRGVDLLGTAGVPVRAARSGTVSYAGRIGGVGSVSVSHGATRTTYQPLLASVSRGDHVREGEVLGHLAVAGGHCLPRVCLHWGLIAGSTYLDPLVLVGAAPGPVRLLPLGGPPTVQPGDPPGRWSGPTPVAPVGGSEPVPRLP
jgi:murein DD-endopeptidase MepM/ murein hydrolase activator NlpD